MVGLALACSLGTKNCLYLPFISLLCYAIYLISVLHRPKLAYNRHYIYVRDITHIDAGDNYKYVK